MERVPEVRTRYIDGLVYATSHSGGRSQNEDDFLVMPWDGGWVLAVADGLGGHRAGDVASRCAIKTLADCLQGQTDRDPVALLREIYGLIHKSIKRYAQGERAGMGTTLVTVCVQGHFATIASTGDSRAYIVRDRVTYRTRDHSVVQGFVENGVLTENEARRHPMRNLLTAALGIDLIVEVETLSLISGDTILLASDGFYEFISEEQMVSFLHSKNLSESGEGLFQKVLQETTDNVTLILYRVP
ncbi:MAG: protein phosphatase 2C domain-containing protein [Methanomicrobiales archaeon]|nr:protein phosphatase 2C domain-containing protein [Methanomicrobiales archaeon]